MQMPSALTVMLAITPTAGALFPCLVALLTIHRAVPSRLKRHRRLLPALGTSDRRSLRFASGILAGSGLFILLCLTARLAALGHRKATHFEEFLIFACKRKFLPAVGTGELQILSH